MKLGIIHNLNRCGKLAVSSVVAACVLIASTANAETTVPPKQPTVPDKSGNRLLDKLSIPAAGAYGLRQLRSAHSGAAIEVRRSSDNTTAKIGFAENGDLDVAALLKFVGKDSGTIKTWYDQSGNNRDLEQPNVDRQRLIVDGGKLVVLPGSDKPAHTQRGEGESYGTQHKTGRVRAVASVIHPTALVAPNTASCVYWTGDGGMCLFIQNNKLALDCKGWSPPIKNDVKAVDTSLALVHLHPSDKTAKREAYSSGNLIGAQEGANFSGSMFQIGGVFTLEFPHNPKVGDGFAGFFSEIIYFTKDLPGADRELIEGSQTWHFGLEKSLPDTHPYKKNAPK
jgi:hypothetical protein